MDAVSWNLEAEVVAWKRNIGASKSEIGTWKLENVSWNAYPGPGYTRTPAAPGLARGTSGPNILIDVRRQGVADQVYARQSNQMEIE